MVTTMNATSFDAWVTARQASLLRFGYLVTGSAEGAQDAVQTALAEAFARWEHVGRLEDPETYVRRMIANAHISNWRRFGRRQVVVAEPRGGAGGDASERIAEHDAVWRMCATLPPQQRAAVVLRFYEDLDYPEIAGVLGCSETTARSHIHRALRRLHTTLTAQGTNR
jgi:RNA polymerase sigma-70 factor (sigma-E family)